MWYLFISSLFPDINHALSCYLYSWANRQAWTTESTTPSYLVVFSYAAKYVSKIKINEPVFFFWLFLPGLFVASVKEQPLLTQTQSRATRATVQAAIT